MTTLHNMTIKQGDSITLTLTVNQGGGPFNLTGSTFAFALAKRASRHNEPQIFQKTWAFDPSLAVGTTVFKLLNTETQPLIPGDYTYDIKLKDSTGTITTIVTGGIRVLATPITPF